MSVRVVPECLPLCVEYPAAPLAFASLVVVVGSRATQRPSSAFVGTSASRQSPSFQSLDVGVGSDFASDSRLGLNSPTRPALPPRFEPLCCAVGVGSHCVEAVSDMGRPVLRGGLKQRRSPDETHVSKSLPDGLEVLLEERDVLEEDEGRIDFIDDADEVGPERSLVFVPALLAGDAVGLTR